MERNTSFKFVSLILFAASVVVSTTQFASSEETASARGMFFEQVKKPEAKLNTGVIYWVELDRAGQKSHVNNKTEFVEGDKIRFHFKPNIDGYAYIQVAEGAEKATLFPSAQLPDNKVKCGEEIVLPFAKGTDQAWLRFDDNPGTETVRIIVSRTPINLNGKTAGNGSKEVEPELKVSSSTTNADKIPDGTFVSMDEPIGGMMAGSRGLSLEVRHAPEEAGEIAVVNADPKKELAIDISLDHKKKGH